MTRGCRRRPPRRRGPKPKKGPRLPSPKEAAAKADRHRGGPGPWRWQAVTVVAYQWPRQVQALTYVAVWPSVLGLVPVRVVAVRDPSGKLKDAFLFTTDVTASVWWVIEAFAKRWSIEVRFRASKQVFDIEGPQNWSRESIEKLAPWVWLMMTVVMVWYVAVGYDSPEAKVERGLMGEWDSEWSWRHMVKVLRRATLNATIDPTTADAEDLLGMVETLKNCVTLTA
jgi:hypothetical protein